MIERNVDPTSLVGDRLVGVTVAWGVSGVERRPGSYLLRFESGVELTPTLSADATIERVADASRSVAHDRERLELEAIETYPALTGVVGETIVGVDRVWWLGGGGTGLRFRVADGALVIAHDPAPPSHGEVAILDGDVGEDWGSETIG